MLTTDVEQFLRASIAQLLDTNKNNIDMDDTNRQKIIVTNTITNIEVWCHNIITDVCRIKLNTCIRKYQ